LPKTPVVVTPTTPGAPTEAAPRSSIISPRKN
jgi:hypothetical protein